MSRFGFAALAIALIVGAYLGALYLAQRSLLFPAPPRPPPVSPGRAEIVRLPLARGEARALFLAPDDSFAGPAPLVIFMHGNGELIDFWPGEFNEIRAAGFAVLLVEYPGYGRSTGRPTQQSLTDAALAAYDWVKAVPGIDSTRIVAYGRSRGGGAACALVA